MSTAHLDDEQVQRVLHRELGGALPASLAGHVAECAECRARVDAAASDERGVFALLGRLDHPMPNVDAQAVMRRARRPAAGWGRSAASIVVMLAIGGVAYAAPGSPLPWLLTRLFPGKGDPPPTAPKPVPRPEAGAAGRPDPGAVTQGISVAPSDRFAIVFSSRQPGSVMAVSLTDAADISVRALGGAATFTADIDHLSIGNADGSARFEIEIPRHARRVEIKVAGYRVFLKEGAGVVADGARDTEGRYLVPLSGAGS
ncbi:MAG TPA: hypothetical protein VFZ21_19670 [Gemmatimonadaceae bacterium]|nr:hypothetical protein [Gemmatimonadaceae bacterium]